MYASQVLKEHHTFRKHIQFKHDRKGIMRKYG